MSTHLYIMVCPFCETWSASRTDSAELNQMFSTHLKEDH